MTERHRSVTWLAQQLPCDRSNIYDIFRRDDISTGLLMRISVLLEHDFFHELSVSLRQENEIEWGGVKSAEENRRRRQHGMTATGRHVATPDTYGHPDGKGLEAEVSLQSLVEA